MTLPVPAGASGTYTTPYFDDAFPGSSLNSANWNNPAVVSYGQFVWGDPLTIVSQASLSTVSSGLISAIAAKSGGNWPVGAIDGYGKAAQLLQSGIMIISFTSCDCSQGQWPAIWTLPASGTSSGQSSNGEMDLWEGGYNKNQTLSGAAVNGFVAQTLHMGGTNGPACQYWNAPSGPLTSGVHTVAVEKIFGKSVKFWVDGVLQQTYINGTVDTAHPAGSSGSVNVVVDNLGAQLFLQSGAAASDASSYHTVGSPSIPSDTMFFEVTMYYSGASGGSVPSFTADSPSTSATVSTTYSYAFAASGSPSPTFSVSSGSLPPGLTLNTSSGLLSGTPTTAGSGTFAVTASNSAGSATTPALTITVSSSGASAPVFTADSPPPATLGTAYNYMFAASGSPAPVFTLMSGSVPRGMLLASTGTLAGTPTAAGVFSFVVKAANASGSVQTSTLSITVSTTSSGGAITRVQWGDYGGANSGQTVTPGFNGLAVNDVQPGNSVLLAFIVYGNDSIASVSTTFGTAVNVNADVTSFVGDQEFWYIETASGGGNEITATTVSGSQLSVQFSEWSGAGPCTSGAYAATDDAAPALTVSPGATGALVVTQIASAGTLAGGPASPAVDYNSGVWLLSNGQDLAYVITTSSSAVTTTWTQSANNTGLLGVYITPKSSASLAGLGAFSFAGAGAIAAALTAVGSFAFAGTGAIEQLALVGAGVFTFSGSAALVGFQPESLGTIDVAVPRFPSITVEVT